MNSPPAPQAPEPQDASTAREDEQLAHAYKQIVHADEQLARLSEQVARMERDAAPASSAGPGPQSPSESPASRTLFGLPLAACAAVVALVLLSSYGGAKLVAARWPSQPASAQSLPRENPQVPAALASSAVQLAAAEPASAQAHATPAQAAAVAQPQDAAPAAAAASPDYTQLLQTMARDLANVQRSIEQLNATQQQIARVASDNSKDIAELKASQEEMKRTLAKLSEQNLARASPPPAQPALTLRKPERTALPQRPRPRPWIPRQDWIYDDW
ncbi:MAG: hypothetical protein GY844_14290 [Bradyrhizobium sp.]|nr:hypothetical protein [Bradyrhizobium sp.]